VGILKRRLVIVILVFILGGLFISVHLYNLSAMGNPVVVGCALSSLRLDSTDIVKINEQPEKYIMKTETGYSPFIKLMNRRGWALQEQTNKQLVFTSADGDLTARVSINGKYRLILLPKDAPTRVEPRFQEITLTAAGDILMHNTQIYSGLQTDGSYRYDSFFVPVKKLLEEGDYCSTNFEAAMAGPESGYTGYPLFNSPDAMADTLKEGGFDLVITANNHCLDRGYAGGVRTLDILHRAGLDTTGTYSNLSDSKKYLVKNINGVKVAYLAYTYSTNGIPVPKDRSYFVNMLDTKRIVKDIKAVRPYSDFIVLVMHWGVEYNPQATDEQKEMARQFFKAGADIILGSHPHVIEPMEVIKVNGTDKFVIYSMGNFIGHQRGLERNSGVVLKFKLAKDMAQGKTLLKEVSYTPTFSHSYRENGRLQFRVVPVEETIQKIQAGQDPYLDQSYIPVLKAVLKNTQNQLGPNDLILNSD
jgi:poly-gamma-glutamate synthesis protein (capsule biosynthesis protein)